MTEQQKRQGKTKNDQQQEPLTSVESPTAAEASKPIPWGEASRWMKHELLRVAIDDLHDLSMRLDAGAADWCDEADARRVDNIEGLLELFALDYDDASRVDSVLAVDRSWSSPHDTSLTDVLSEERPE